MGELGGLTLRMVPACTTGSLRPLRWWQLCSREAAMRHMWGADHSEGRAGGREGLSLMVALFRWPSWFRLSLALLSERVPALMKWGRLKCGAWGGYSRSLKRTGLWQRKKPQSEQKNHRARCSAMHLRQMDPIGPGTLSFSEVFPDPTETCA